jgi:ATP synthase protein I
MTNADQARDRLEEAARQEAERTRRGHDDPEPSLGARLGQIGLLGWTIVIPALLALWAGRQLDFVFSTGIAFTAAFVMLGISFGFWLAWRWMHKQ